MRAAGIFCDAEFENFNEAVFVFLLMKKQFKSTKARLPCKRGWTCIRYYCAYKGHEIISLINSIDFHFISSMTIAGRLPT